MKLISDFKDYYDPVFIQLSHDPSNMFIRKTHEIFIESESFPTFVFDKNHERIKTGIIGFCGKFYPYMLRYYYINPKDPSYDGYRTIPQYYYTFQEFGKIIEFKKLYGRKLFSSYNTKKDVELWFNKGTYYYSPVDFISKLRFMDIFKQYNCCYFNTFTDNECARHKSKVVIYPVLNDCQFYRVFDLYSAYQQIEQYLLNELAKPDAMKINPIPDHIKAQSKGFNKWSFRSEPKSNKIKIHV